MRRIVILAICAIPISLWAKDKPAAPTISDAQTQQLRAIKATYALIQKTEVVPLVNELNTVYDALDKAAPEGWCFVAQPTESYAELSDGQTCDHTQHRIILKPPAAPAK
jgi:hypothetical protein